MLRMAEMIRDATQVGENTAVRVGTEIYDIVVELSRMLDMMDDKLENDAVVRIIKSELAKITITDAQIADGAITAAKLADGSVKNRHLASNCVTSDKLQPGAVKHDHHWSVVGPNKIYQGATRCVISETPFCLFIELSKKSALWNLKIFREITRSIC